MSSWNTRLMRDARYNGNSSWIYLSATLCAYKATLFSKQWHAGGKQTMGEIYKGEGGERIIEPVIVESQAPIGGNDFPGYS